MVRQIFVFTNSFVLDTLQLIKNEAKMPFFLFKPSKECLPLLEHHPLPSPLEKLRPGDFLLIRTNGLTYEDSDLEIADHLQKRYQLQLSHPLATLRILRDKGRQAQWLQHHGFLHPRTLHPTAELDDHQLSALKGEFLILKTKRGHQGRGVFKLPRRELLTYWQEQVRKGDLNYIIQEYHEGYKELRLLVFKEQVFLIEKSGPHWKKNSQYCSFSPYRGEEKQVAQLTQLAQELRAKLGSTVFAVDVFVTSNPPESLNAITIIEINANPGLKAASQAFPHKNLYREFLRAFGLW